MALSSQHPGRFLVHSNNEESGHLINTQSMARLKNELNITLKGNLTLESCTKDAQTKILAIYTF